MTTWSQYQTAIFTEVEGNTCNLAIDAVAGSGKTTTLVQVSKILPRSKKVVFLAFNKHIVSELQSRLEGVDCSTIHSLGMKACSAGYRNGRVMVNQYKVKDLIDDMLDDAQDIPMGVFGQFAKVVSEIVDKGRLTLTDLANAAAVDAMLDHFGILTDLVTAAQQAEVSVDYLVTRASKMAAKVLRKSVRLYQEKGRIDFTDMLYLPAALKLPVARYDVVLVDEAQDLSAAQLAIVLGAAGYDERSGKTSGRVIAVGDPCQPVGTMVKTIVRNGDRWHPAVYADTPIEQIGVGERVLSYCVQDNHFYTSCVTGVTAKQYNGPVVKVQGGGCETRYTLNHRCIASFEALRSMYVVYMMRKGAQFRVGMSKVDQPSNKCSGPLARFKTEGADALWLLSYYPTYIEAATMEQAISGKFGIPQLMFGTARARYPEVIKNAWAWIGNNVERGLACLNYFGRKVMYPLMTKNDPAWSMSLKRPIEVRACNLMDGCFMLPFTGKRKSGKVDWVAVTVEREHYDGLVYSLDVEKYHTYVADGLATHNCQAINGFAGADNRSFAKIVERTNAKVLPLSVCYRCPVSHLDLARELVSHIEAAPGAGEGTVEHITMDLTHQLVRQGDLFVCRLNAPLVGAALKLIAKGVQARVRGRNIASGLVKMIDDACKITVADAGSWRATFTKQLERLVAIRLEMLAQKEHSEVAQETVRDQGECVFTFLDGSPTITDAETLKTELQALFADEGAAVWLSTIHKAKGLEADRVFILRPDRLELTRKGMLDWQKEQERNLHCVALTRAKKTLYFVEEGMATGAEVKTTVGDNRVVQPSLI